VDRLLVGAELQPPPPFKPLQAATGGAAAALEETTDAAEAETSRDAALAAFMHQHYTKEKIARAIDSNAKGQARGGFNIKFKGNNQVGAGWFHSREQYRAVLRLAFFTEDRVRPPTLNREAAPCTQALGRPAWHAQATVLRYPPPRSTGPLAGGGRASAATTLHTITSSNWWGGSCT
jgi:hypothetical protein